MKRELDREMLEHVAYCLQYKFRDIRWRFCEQLNSRLDETDCEYRLFDHCGIVAVGVAALANSGGEEKP